MSDRSEQDRADPTNEETTDPGENKRPEVQGERHGAFATTPTEQGDNPNAGKRFDQSTPERRF